MYAGAPPLPYPFPISSSTLSRLLTVTQPDSIRPREIRVFPYLSVLVCISAHIQPLIISNERCQAMPAFCLKRAQDSGKYDADKGVNEIRD